MKKFIPIFLILYLSSWAGQGPPFAGASEKLIPGEYQGCLDNIPDCRRGGASLDGGMFVTFNKNGTGQIQQGKYLDDFKWEYPRDLPGYVIATFTTSNDYFKKGQKVVGQAVGQDVIYFDNLLYINKKAIKYR